MPVIAEARAAALSAMADTFGNPSSVHGAGLRARAMVDGSSLQMLDMAPL